MKSAELVEKIEQGWATPGIHRDADIAKCAFLLNLRQQLGWEYPEEIDKLEDPKDKLFVLLERFKTRKEDVPDKDIKQAHLSLSFPWSRAIISKCLLDSKNVTMMGVPPGYAEDQG